MGKRKRSYTATASTENSLKEQKKKIGLDLKGNIKCPNGQLLQLKFFRQTSP